MLNAAMLYWPMPNVLYVEGYALDRFAEGLWALQPVHQNKVCFSCIVEHSTVIILLQSHSTKQSTLITVLQSMMDEFSKFFTDCTQVISWHMKIKHKKLYGNILDLI